MSHKVKLTDELHSCVHILKHSFVRTIRRRVDANSPFRPIRFDSPKIQYLGNYDTPRHKPRCLAKQKHPPDTMRASGLTPKVVFIPRRTSTSADSFRTPLFLPSNFVLGAQVPLRRRNCCSGTSPGTIERVRRRSGSWRGRIDRERYDYVLPDGIYTFLVYADPFTES